MEKEKIMSCFLLLSIIFMSVAMSGCTEDDETTEPNAEMSVLDAEVRATDSNDTTPGPGNGYLYLKVEIKSLNEDEDLSLNPASFELETDQGGKYNFNDQIDAPDNLAPGSTSEFWISFEIPENRTGETLYYEPSWLQEEPYTDTVPTYSTEPSMEYIHIDEVSHGNENRTSVLCEWITEDGRAYYKGSERPAKNGSGTVPPAKGYDQELVITVIDENGNKMSGVDLVAERAGVTSVATTNATGQAELSLEGCRLLQNQQSTKITVTATYEGMMGTESVQDTILVERP